MKTRLKHILIFSTILLLTACTFPAAANDSNLLQQDTLIAVDSSGDQMTVDQITTTDFQNLINTVQQVYQKIYTEVNPSVVNIQVVESYGFSYLSGQGSGFIWDDEGHIVTNYHVIENATDINVVFADGSSAAAMVVGTDKQSDLAVIKVEPLERILQPVAMGDSKAVQVGDLVVAIGNPYGLAGTMTQGIVSALSRSLTVDESNPFYQTNYTIPDIIQTDAAVNPGNSGGVLVNIAGEVIGVPSAIQSSTSSNAGIAFAIPAHIVELVVPDLINKGYYEHPSLGLVGSTMTLSIAAEMGLDENTKGILITSITRGGPADTAGLVGTNQYFVRPGRYVVVYGDVITAIDGQVLRTYEELVSYLFNHTAVGQEVTLSILRDGELLEVPLVLMAD